MALHYFGCTSGKKISLGLIELVAFSPKGRFGSKNLFQLMGGAKYIHDFNVPSLDLPLESDLAKPRTHLLDMRFGDDHQSPGRRPCANPLTSITIGGHRPFGTLNRIAKGYFPKVGGHAAKVNWDIGFLKSNSSRIGGHRSKVGQGVKNYTVFAGLTPTC